MRWSDLDAGEELRELLADRRVADVEAPPNFAVVVGGPDGPTVTKHTLYEANRRMMRTASGGRVTRAILRGLAALEAPPSTGSAVPLEAAVVVRADGSAVLVDRRYRWALDEVAPDLARAGATVVDTSTATIDPAGRTCSVDMPDGWPGLVAAVGDDGRRDRIEARNAPAAMPIARIAVDGFGANDTPAGRIGSVLALLAAGAASTLDLAGFARAISDLDVVAIGPAVDGFARLLVG